MPVHDSTDILTVKLRDESSQPTMRLRWARRNRLIEHGDGTAHWEPYQALEQAWQLVEYGQVVSDSIEWREVPHE